MGNEAIKSLYSVIKPLLTSEDQKKFFEENILPTWTSFSPFEDSKTIFIPIQNPNSDFRMNERVFNYEESAFKEQNLKYLSKEGLYLENKSGKKSKHELDKLKQK